MLKRAAAYPRYSSDNQREESIDAQMKYINDYARQKGYEIVKIYPDEAKTATSDRRPAFQEMMRDAAKGLFDFVIVHKLDRFSRDRYDFAYYRRLLRKHGIRLISVLENLDDSPESVMMESVLEGMAEYYSKNLSREVMRKGMIPNAEKCKHNGGVPPLGYDVNSDKHYVINEREAEAVRYIYKAYLDGSGYGHICEWLSQKGIKSKLGNPIAKNSIHDILINEKYSGVYIYNRTTSKDAYGHRNNRKSKNTEDIIRIEDGMPAIISKETYKMAMDKMENNRTGAHKAIEPYLLSGIIFCGKCGGAMVGTSQGSERSPNSQKQRFYECSKRKRAKTCDMRGIKRDDIENAVIDYLENLISSEMIDNLSVWLNENAKLYMKDRKAELKSARSELSAAARKVERILDKILDGLDSESARTRLKEAEEKKASLELQVAELEEKSEQTFSITKTFIKNYLLQLKSIRSKTRAEQAEIIKRFVDKVIVHEKDPNSTDRSYTIKTKLDLLLGASSGIKTDAGRLHQFYPTNPPHWLVATKSIKP